MSILKDRFGRAVSVAKVGDLKTYTVDDGETVFELQLSATLSPAIAMRTIEAHAPSWAEKPEIGEEPEQAPQTVVAEAGDPIARGPRGFRGDRGFPGKDGESVKGAPGEKGDKGDTGAPGKDGAPGATGETGPRGAKGDKGDQGLVGPEGKRGYQGIPGPTGATGERGEKGDKGDQSNQGERGPTGAKGDKGDTGAQGESIKGDKGDQGIPGKDGKNGRDGVDLTTPPPRPAGRVLLGTSGRLTADRNPPGATNTLNIPDGFTRAVTLLVTDGVGSGARIDGLHSCIGGVVTWEEWDHKGSAAIDVKPDQENRGLAVTAKTRGRWTVRMLGAPE